YTYAGDSNLDRRVDLTDFTYLAANFNKIGGAAWMQGDYNYDSNVDLTDFTRLASNFNQTLPAAELGATVPEPAISGGISFVACSLLAPRRRSRQIAAGVASDACPQTK